MTWLTGQFAAWQELLWGLMLLVAGLFLEDWIDRYRGRKGKDR